MNLESELSSIKGVGPKTAEKLAKAGFSTVGDVIDFLPRTYEDFSQVVTIKDLAPGKVTIKAKAENVTNRRPRFKMSITEATLRDATGAVRAVWFNQFYRQKQLETGEEFYVSGIFEFARGRYQLTNPSVEAVKDLPVQTGRVLPVYPAIKGLKPSLTRSVLDKLRPVITMLSETLPNQIVKAQKLSSRAEAMSGLHFPGSALQADKARERLAFEELFELLLASQLNKQENTKLKGFHISFDQPKIKEFVAKLPFEMTNAQKRALWDILCDFEGKGAGQLGFPQKTTSVFSVENRLCRLADEGKPLVVPHPPPMNRMLQGDVGSGKTVVAGAAAYQAVLAGYQTAIMAPTEILATQHARTLDKLLSPFGVKVALLTGSVKGKPRTELYKQIANGEVDVAIGTHALFQKDVKFYKLGFVVIDEQHRFGVKQRQELLDKSGNCMPHLLSMTATPIPRSLQLTVFGDLDISILNELPKGRQPIETKIFRPKEREEVYAKIEEQLKQGRQAYIVTPLIEERESEKPFKNVVELRNALLKVYKRDTAHKDYQGKWSSKNKTCGQCVPTSLLVKDIFGGDIFWLDSEHHHYNVIDGKVVDLTKEQFDYELDYSQGEKVDKIYNDSALLRYELLKKRLLDTVGSKSTTEKVAAEEEYKKITKKFKNYKVGLLHGKMKADEKEQVMKDFAEHKIDILVATTVVEVGVDVPNATVMMIENADQFGLSQLHQLRGRVGRGEHKSYCFLVMTENKSPSRRLKEIEKSNDGFYLSEVDLQLRGPGQIYGTMQHGELNLQIANLADTKLIKRASDSAKWFIDNENLANYPELAKNVIKYQKLTNLN